MKPSYDLVTITLNSAKSLQRTLDSVEKQKTLPTRYIFIDANSEDQTVKIIEDFKSKNVEIEVIIEQQTGLGISQAWNQALSKVQSEIICLLNSDDWWQPNTMEKVLGEFQSDQELQILSGSILFCKDENDPNPKLMNPKPPWQMPFRMCFMHPATFVRKSVYEKIGTFNEEYKSSMDYDFMFRALKSRLKIKSLKKPLVYMQAGGIANSTRKRARKETRDIARIYAIGIFPWISWILRSITGK